MISETPRSHLHSTPIVVHVQLDCDEWPIHERYDRRTQEEKEGGEGGKSPKELRIISIGSKVTPILGKRKSTYTHILSIF